MVGAVSVEPGDGAGDGVEDVVDAAVSFGVVVMLAQVY
mgnify:FL=1